MVSNNFIAFLSGHQQSCQVGNQWLVRRRNPHASHPTSHRDHLANLPISQPRDRLQNLLLSQNCIPLPHPQPSLVSSILVISRPSSRHCNRHIFHPHHRLFRAGNRRFNRVNNLLHSRFVALRCNPVELLLLNQRGNPLDCRQYSQVHSLSTVLLGNPFKSHLDFLPASPCAVRRLNHCVDQAFNRREIQVASLLLSL